MIPTSCDKAWATLSHIPSYKTFLDPTQLRSFRVGILAKKLPFGGERLPPPTPTITCIQCLPFSLNEPLTCEMEANLWMKPKKDRLSSCIIIMVRGVQCNWMTEKGIDVRTLRPYDIGMPRAGLRDSQRILHQFRDIILGTRYVQIGDSWPTLHLRMYLQGVVPLP